MSASPAGWRLAAGLWWLAALGGLLAVAAWIGAAPAGVAGLDRQGMLLAHAVRSRPLDAALSAATWLGSLVVLLPFAVAAAAWLWRGGRRREAGFVVAALAGASLLAHAAKTLVLRPRPALHPWLTSPDSQWSYPSAHAMQATALAVALLAIARLAPAPRRWAVVLGLAAVLMVAVSRVYLQVHYPSDVLVGAIAAACWVLGLRALLR